MRSVKANWRDPEFRRRNAEATKANWRDPEFRRRQAEAVKAAARERLSWCPPELVDDYRLLVRHLGADEARRCIEAQMHPEQVIAQCWQCDRRFDDPECRDCTMIGCPLAVEAAA